MVITYSVGFNRKETSTIQSPSNNSKNNNNNISDIVIKKRTSKQKEGTKIVMYDVE